jgi:hypothetical protein
MKLRQGTRTYPEFIARALLELTRLLGHPILGVAQGKEARDGSSSEVPRGVPA